MSQPTYRHFDYPLATEKANILHRATVKLEKETREAPASPAQTRMGLVLATVFEGETLLRLQRSFYEQRIHNIPPSKLLPTDSLKTLGLDKMGDQIALLQAIDETVVKSGESSLKDKDIPVYKIDGVEAEFAGSSEGFHQYKEWIVRQVLFHADTLTEEILWQQSMGQVPVKLLVDKFLLRTLQKTTSQNAHHILTRHNGGTATSGLGSLLKLTAAYGQVNVQQRLAYHKRAHEYNPAGRAVQNCCRTIAALVRLRNVTQSTHSCCKWRKR